MAYDFYANSIWGCSLGSFCKKVGLAREHSILIDSCGDSFAADYLNGDELIDPDSCSSGVAQSICLINGKLTEIFGDNWLLYYVSNEDYGELEEGIYISVSFKALFTETEFADRIIPEFDIGYHAWVTGG